MTIHDQDTDPSTPGARQATSGPGAAGRTVPTDPGVGPPCPRIGQGKASAVVVPPASPVAHRPHAVSVFAAASRQKDSVELLLEGMAGARPDRVKTMPRTAGEASAAYHAEHHVHAAHTTPDSQPKVVVDGVAVEEAEAPPALALEDRTDPSRLDPPLAEVPPGWGPADPTYVPLRRRRGQMAAAGALGVCVVAAMFTLAARKAATTGGPTIGVAAVASTVEGMPIAVPRPREPRVEAPPPPAAESPVIPVATTPAAATPAAATPVAATPATATRVAGLPPAAMGARLPELSAEGAHVPPAPASPAPRRAVSSSATSQRSRAASASPPASPAAPAADVGEFKTSF
jgi:hypothetical protein